MHCLLEVEATRRHARLPHDFVTDLGVFLQPAGPRTHIAVPEGAQAQRVEHPLQGLRALVPLGERADAVLQLAPRLGARVPAAVVRLVVCTAHGLSRDALQGHDHVREHDHHPDHERRLHVAGGLRVAGQPRAARVRVARLLAVLAAVVVEHDHLHQGMVAVLRPGEAQDQLLLVEAALAAALRAPLALRVGAALPRPEANAAREAGGVLYDLLPHVALRGPGAARVLHQLLAGERRDELLAADDAPVLGAPAAPAQARGRCGAHRRHRRSRTFVGHRRRLGRALAHARFVPGLHEEVLAAHEPERPGSTEGRLGLLP
mmetsp:Transcript_27664/g.76091  ORF Transcript_27664/g.76091 Transcript_27664/m.76091 type:complete len:318 (+) Transcript_27664:776-1729(+)